MFACGDAVSPGRSGVRAKLAHRARRSVWYGMIHKTADAFINGLYLRRSMLLDGDCPTPDDEAVILAVWARVNEIEMALGIEPDGRTTLAEYRTIVLTRDLLEGAWRDFT